MMLTVWNVDRKENSTATVVELITLAYSISCYNSQAQNVRKARIPTALREITWDRKRCSMDMNHQVQDMYGSWKKPGVQWGTFKNFLCKINKTTSRFTQILDDSIWAFHFSLEATQIRITSPENGSSSSTYRCYITQVNVELILKLRLILSCYCTSNFKLFCARAYYVLETARISLQSYSGANE